MKKAFILRPATLSIALAAFLAVSGAAFARGPAYGYPGAQMTPEQSAAMLEARAEFNRTILPLQQQMYAKQAELDVLHDGGAEQNDPKVQALLKEINDLDDKLYAAHGEMRSRMNRYGMPFGYGMGRGYDCYGYDGMRRGFSPGSCCAW